MVYFKSIVEIGRHIGVEGPLEAYGNDITKGRGVEQLIKLYGPVTVEVASQTMLMSEL